MNKESIHDHFPEGFVRGGQGNGVWRTETQTSGGSSRETRTVTRSRLVDAHNPEARLQFPKRKRSLFATVAILLFAGGGVALIVLGLGNYPMQGWAHPALPIIFGAVLVVLSLSLWLYGRRRRWQIAFHRWSSSDGFESGHAKWTDQQLNAFHQRLANEPRSRNVKATAEQMKMFQQQIADEFAGNTKEAQEKRRQQPLIVRRPHASGPGPVDLNWIDECRRYLNGPWLKNPKWAGGRIRNSDGKSAFWSYVIAAACLCFVLIIPGLNQLHRKNVAAKEAAKRSPLAHVVTDKQTIDKQENAALYFAIGLALFVGAAFLTHAVVNTRRLIRFGSSTLELATFPGVIGGQLVGIIYTQRKLTPSDGYHLRLRCIHRVVTYYGTGRDRHSAVEETPIWEEQCTMARSVTDGDMSRTAIPVGFSIPSHCRPSDVHTSNDSVRWELQALAKLPGLNYLATFIVPVFRTEDSTTNPTEQVDPVAAYRA